MTVGSRPFHHYLLATFLVLLILASQAFCCDVPSMQYQNISPLPGGGVSINSNGDSDPMGAVQVNIPVAYTPRSGYLSLGAYRGGHTNTGGEVDNGSGIIGIGLGKTNGIYISAMQVSRVWDESKAVNAQVLVLPEKGKMPAFAIGMQDIREKEDGNRSLYGVATKAFPTKIGTVFATLGFGGGRFKEHFFAGASLCFNDQFSFITEWDGYQWNNGVTWRPGGIKSKISLMAAYNGEAGWLFGAGISFNLSKK